MSNIYREDLKPCPFCGFGYPSVVTYPGQDGFRDRYAVRCDYTDGGCGAEGGWRHYVEEAVEVWNGRAE